MKRVKILLMSIKLQNYCQEWNNNAKSLKALDSDYDSEFDIKSMLQHVGVDLILAGWTLLKDFSILQSPDIWITKTGASNDCMDQKKGIMNFKKDELSLGVQL